MRLISSPLRWIWAATLVLVLAWPSDLHAQAPRLYAGGSMGYQNGPAVQFFGLARDFAEGLPVTARLRLGWAGVEPGSAAAARRIFINNATNGTPEKKGRTLDMGLDAIFPFGDRATWYAGVRRSSFKANFRYVGGNEDFDVVSTQWGIALGAETTYEMGARTALVFSGGAEYFRASRLTGHDTSYSPDGDNANPREEYVYADADDAIAQPKLRPVLLVGVRYRLGR